MTRVTLLILSFLFSFSAQAADIKAGILTEPYAGYFQGETEGADLGDADIKSYTVGARLGYQTEAGWNYGIDYAQGKGKYQATGESKFDYNSKDGGIFIGYSFAAHIKVWASYIFKYESLIKGYGTGGVDVEVDGDGFNVGIGIRGIPFVSVNITYQERSVGKIDSVDVGSDNKIKLTMLSLSLPYNFPWKP